MVSPLPAGRSDSHPDFALDPLTSYKIASVEYTCSRIVGYRAMAESQPSWPEERVVALGTARCGLPCETPCSVEKYVPNEKNCKIFRIFRSGKGDRPLLPERPAGCCAQKGSVPFSFPCVTSIVLQFFCDEPYVPKTEHKPGNPDDVPAHGRRRNRLLFAAGCTLTLTLVVLFVFLRGVDLRKRARPPAADGDALGTLPGEFERQQTILLAWPRVVRPASSPNATDAYRTLDQVYCDIVRAIRDRISVVVLVEDSRTEDHVTRLLSERQIPTQDVQFMRIPFESHWIRDYGPLGVRGTHDACLLIDAEYADGPVAVYPHEDRLPKGLGRRFEMPTVSVPLTIHHGNLLSNGRGLCIATEKLLEENVGRGYDADDVKRILGKFYGAMDVVFLESLRGEPTGHVDMFASFTSHDTVVIGEYLPAYDPENALILDRNAERLGRQVKVVRIPMPPRVPSPSGTDFWPTYTNVAYANGMLLVPVFPGWEPQDESRALAVYRRLLPGWTIVEINAVPALRWWGGVHCMTMNLPSLGNSPPTTAEQRSQPGSS